MVDRKRLRVDRRLKTLQLTRDVRNEELRALDVLPHGDLASRQDAPNLEKFSTFNPWLWYTYIKKYRAIFKSVWGLGFMIKQNLIVTNVFVEIKFNKLV
jgi:hypothetical protein